MIKRKIHIKLVLFLGICLSCLNSHGQDLQTLIDSAISNNPGIQKFDLQYKIASEKLNEVNTLPNTEFNLGVMAISPQTEMPMERFRVSVMQMLPWFGTLSARENYALSMAEAQFVEVTIAKRNLALSVSQFYYQLYEIRADQEVLVKNIALLQTYGRIALTSLEAGQASAVDVLRLQIRENGLKQQLDVLTEQYQGIQAAMNSLMNREYDKDVSVVSSLEIPEVDNFYSYGSLSINPELLKYDKLYHSIEQSELLNQKESGPMVGFGLEYIGQDNSPMITSPYKDMIMPMVTLSIPIFNNKYKSRTEQNELRRQEIRSQKDERQNVLQAKLSKAISQRNQARIKFDTQKKNLKQAEDAEEILLKGYETGTIDFGDILDIQELQLKFQMEKIASIREYYEQSAIINYLIN